MIKRLLKETSKTHNILKPHYLHKNETHFHAFNFKSINQSTRLQNLDPSFIKDYTYK